MWSWIRAGAGWEFGRRNSGVILFVSALVRLWPLTLVALAVGAGVTVWRLRPDPTGHGWIVSALVVLAGLVLAWLFIVSIQARVWPLTWIVLAVAAAGAVALWRPSWIRTGGIVLAALVVVAFLLRVLSRRGRRAPSRDLGRLGF